MRSIFFAALVAIGCSVLFTSAQSQVSPGAKGDRQAIRVSDQAKKARIKLVSEFVGELEILYRLQETAKREFAEDNSAQGRLVTGIRVGSRTVFEMNDSINHLNQIAVAGRWAEFRDLLRQAHEHRIAIVQEMNQMAKALLEGPKPGVNYGALSARAPELTAQIEQLDKTMFTMAQALFFGLVDEGRVGADGNLHYLLLTRAERSALVRLIDNIFGGALENKDASSIVSAAWAIKFGLTRPTYKSADET